MKTLKTLFGTHIGRLLVAAVLTIAGGLTMAHTEDKLHIGAALMLLGLGTLVVYFVVMMIFGIKGTIEDNKKK